MRQDKFVELRIAQLHWNAVPRLAFGHLDPESIEILADSPNFDKKADLQRLLDNFTFRKNLQPVDQRYYRLKPPPSGDSEFGRGGCSPVQILLTQGAVQAD
jgi:hypothetical protein